MTSKLPLSPESPAYRLFIEEVDKHIAFAREHALSGTVTPEIAKQLGASFHTIRGSAGFFSLEEIAALSKELEEHFFSVAAGTPLNMALIRPNLDKLIDLTGQLPRAAQP